MSKLHRAMFAFIIVFLSSLLWPLLPSVAIMAFGAVILILCLHFRTKTWILGALVGFLWASSVGHWYSSWQLPNRYFNENVLVEGDIQTLQISLEKSVQINKLENTMVYSAENADNVAQKTFMFGLKKIGKTSLLHSPSVRLSWFDPAIDFQQGDTLRLLVSIKRPHALANESGFNRQKWLASLNVVGIGNVRASPSNALLNKGNSIRQKVAETLLRYANAGQVQNVRWILALSLGERALFEQADWRLLQTTGTAHLFAISGLHLGIVSFLFFSVVKSVLFIGNRLLKCKAQYNIVPLALLVSVPFCVFYAYLSGFQIPVIRSLIALVLVALLMLCQSHWRPLAVFLYLLVGFFILFPLSILGMSFWFSFGAIFAICFFVWRFPQGNKSALATVKQTIALQLFLSIIMLPLIGMNFGVLSTVSALVNLLVMPVVSLLLVPMCLVLIILILLNAKALSMSLLNVIDWAFEQLILCMQVFASAPYATIEVPAYSSITWLLLLAIMLLMFLPAWPHRKKVTAALGIAVFAQMSTHKVTDNGWSVRVFDIGQGLSVLVRQHNRFLLYDTGQSFLNDRSLAKTVIAPYFDAQSLLAYGELTSASSAITIDYLINSHMDNDHAGGNAFIFSHYNVRQWLTPAFGCTANDSFMWGDLTVSILWPNENLSGDDNNHSCVIKIAGKNHSILLTGDIEKQAEAAILRKYADSSVLNADILLAAHHGSKTSSTLPFVVAVAPTYIVVSSKYQNQWGFPHSGVLANFAKVNAEVFNTAYDGEVVFEVSSTGVSVSPHRHQGWSPWYMHIR